MALHDGKVNWPLFFGCILIAFGPLASLFFVVVAKRAQLVIIALSGAFTWLVAILVTATLWQIIPPLKTSIEATIPVGVVVQEAFRYVFYVLYTRTERAVQKVTTSPRQFPLNDITSSLGTSRCSVYCVCVLCSLFALSFMLKQKLTRLVCLRRSWRCGVLGDALVDDVWQSRGFVDGFPRSGVHEVL